MDLIVPISQIIVVAHFGIAGALKIVQTREQLWDAVRWTEDMPTKSRHLVGGSELLAALGIAVPSLLGMFDIVVGIAATWLAVLMLVATAVHWKRGDVGGVEFNLIMLVPVGLVGFAHLATGL